LETLGAEVVGVLEAVAVAEAEAETVALLVIGGVSRVAEDPVCANTCNANVRRIETNRRRVDNDMLAACDERVNEGE
jgi:hypothetical protein